MKTCLCSLISLLFATVGVDAASPPLVSNVTVSQRAGTKLVDIYYDVADADGDLQQIQMQASGDGGLTFTLPCTSLSGDLANVPPGTHKHIVWNAAVDWNGQYVANLKVRVTANDGTTPVPPPGMVYIPAGPFQMGDNLDSNTTAMPVHNVQVDAYFIDLSEVAKEQWESVKTWAQGNGYSLSGGSFKDIGHPVQKVAWSVCVKWCNARSEKEGLTPCYYTDGAQTLVYRTGSISIDNTMVNWTANGYRLPTEAEWEKAARGGILGQRYPWGDTIIGSQANYAGSGDIFEGQSPATTPVGHYNGAQIPAGVDMANGYGLYDMAGNVSEYCWDFYDSAYYAGADVNNNPQGPVSGVNRVTRGGGADSTTANLRCSNRSFYPPGDSSNSYLGFRCVRGL